MQTARRQQTVKKHKSYIFVFCQILCCIQTFVYSPPIYCKSTANPLHSLILTQINHTYRPNPHRPNPPGHSVSHYILRCRLTISHNVDDGCSNVVSGKVANNTVQTCISNMFWVLPWFYMQRRNAHDDGVCRVSVHIFDNSPLPASFSRTVFRGFAAA